MPDIVVPDALMGDLLYRVTRDGDALVWERITDSATILAWGILDIPADADATTVRAALIALPVRS